jgi:glycosyltransferase involved in cell wall biosynthesis
MANVLIVNANVGNEWIKNSGGRERTFTLAESLWEHNVTVLVFTWDPGSKIEKIRENLTFITVGAEREATGRRNQLIRTHAKLNYDLAIDLLKKRLVKFKTKVRELANESDLIILDHYSGAPFLEDIKDVPIMYNSQNCEIAMGEQLYPDSKQALEITEKMERQALEQAYAVAYCSEEDLSELRKRYSFTNKVYYTPNGADKQETFDVDTRQKSKTIFFIGSGHPPNVVATQRLIGIAKSMPDYNFVACGRASNSLAGKNIPKNLKYLGEVTDEKLHELFSTSFAFINPMETGSGTHLKMMKALSYGIPIISTDVGARGFTSNEIKNSMIIANEDEQFEAAVALLENSKTYEKIVKSTLETFKNYDWEKVQKDFEVSVQSVLDSVFVGKPLTDPNNAKKKVLIYSIIRNRGSQMKQYYNQIAAIVKSMPQYEFYLSIYENDSIDKTKSELFSKDWSIFAGVSIISENIATKYFNSVKDPVRVENLSNARNKAIEAGGFLDICDYVLMVEGDIRYGVEDVEKLLMFDTLEPEFDIVSTTSIRPNGSHYDMWATRTTPEYREGPTLEDNWKNKVYGSYYSTSNGVCLYRADAFRKGARHHWINKVTKEFDCEMVVLCQEFQKVGHDKIFIRYDARSYH